MLTDLEAAAVGEIRKHEPCTGHFVRHCFRSSLSKRFSESAGSVYPMIKRLEKRGVLESSKRKEGQRWVRYLTVTSSGMSALREWLGPPVADDALITVDPLRTRMLYLDELSKSRRLKWFEEVQTLLEAKLELVKNQLANIDISGRRAVFAELAVENGIVELQSRLKWLARSKKRLQSEGLL